MGRGMTCQPGAVTLHVSQLVGLQLYVGSDECVLLGRIGIPINSTLDISGWAKPQQLQQ
jgi:hypothetical protein